MIRMIRHRWLLSKRLIQSNNNKDNNNSSRINPGSRRIRNRPLHSCSPNFRRWPFRMVRRKEQRRSNPSRTSRTSANARSVATCTWSPSVRTWVRLASCVARRDTLRPYVGRRSSRGSHGAFMNRHNQENETFLLWNQPGTNFFEPYLNAKFKKGKRIGRK
uniref:(northern house mosquito) hypothetical protein n=1 Tax=Culex pipiens TaxID=7175 RepID=A0A8D8ATK8_CULPI